jgi:hypothetical protein
MSEIISTLVSHAEFYIKNDYTLGAYQKKSHTANLI